MNFDLTESEQLLEEAVRGFAADRLAKSAQERERNHQIEPDTIRALGEQGLLGVNLPESLGGSELGVVSYAIAILEVAKADASVAVTMAVTNMVGEVIRAFGTSQQQEEHIPRLTSGEYFGGAFALSEPGAGSDAGALTTRAVLEGDQWVLNGEKMWITTGDQAGVLVVWARTGGEGPGGLSCFLVPQGAEGLRAGRPEEKMGLRASHTVSLSLQDVRVPRSALLGQEGEGFKIAMVALDGGRIGVSAQALGIGWAAFEAARDYAKERQQFGRPIAEFQGVQFKFADMATELEASWLLVQRAAWLKEQGRRFSREAAMAKVMASESANRAVREAVQIFGGYGYTEEFPVARYYRDCRVTQIYEGTSEIQRVVIGRDVLKEAGA